MTQPAIVVENLGKQYQLGANFQPYRTLRETLTDLAGAPFRGLRRLRRASTGPEWFWALRGLTFSVEPGEVLGVIGRNGAGKTTLLKLLARITDPTEGQAVLHGRLGSLLEVGTGFHPELTGRENVFLNGAILGMRRREILDRFDEIVSFSEIARFLDTPVKRYSSGMYMRLAFAVAAHLEPEILVVDEVLAVGDAAFQKKCLGKMGQVARSGRTILFVSHNMPAIRNLCTRTAWIDRGQLRRIGATAEVVHEYLQESQSLDSGREVQAAIGALASDPAFRFLDVRVLQDGRETLTVGNAEPVEVSIEYEVLQETVGLRVFLDLLDEDEVLLFRTFQDDDEDTSAAIAPGRYRSTARIPALLLAPRIYTLAARATVHNVRMCQGSEGLPMRLEVLPTGRLNRAYPHEPIRGRLQPWIPWETTRVE